jgi:signal transduction histidine kinase
VAAIENREERLWLITLESGQGFLRAFSREGLTNAQPGATMRLTGAWATAPESLRKEVAAGLWLAPPGDQVLLAPPPAASVTGTTGAKNHGKLWLGAGGLGLALGFTVSGLTFLRSRKSAAQLLAETETARQRLAELEREYQAQIEARERLGRDLHDHTIQSIYAIGLNLDDCTHLLRQDPEKVEARLRTALMEVNAVISELRNVILGLETNAIQPREFRTALKSLALALGHEKSNKIRLDIDQGALEGLTPVQATELVHIAREAMSNSIRHGAAQTTTFALALVPEGIRFMVQDDGRGFETSSQPRHGFGLRNMAKRAEALGAKFTVSSRPGHGTRITLDIPKQKQHPTVNESRTRIDS